MEELPSELLLSIFSHLSLLERLQTRTLSRSFRELIPPPITEWRHLIGMRVVGLGWKDRVPSRFLNPPRPISSKYKTEWYAGPKLQFYFLLRDSAGFERMVLVISDLWKSSKGQRCLMHLPPERSSNWRLREVDRGEFPLFYGHQLPLSERILNLVSFTPTDWSFNDVYPERERWEYREEIKKTCQPGILISRRWYIWIVLETQTIRLGASHNTTWKLDKNE